MLVIWLFLVYVASAEKCEVHPENGKVIKPLVSVKNGAKFLAYSRLDDSATCHQGCCGSAKCDASFHTGSRLDSKGDNCFYFHCGGSCITDTGSNTEFSTSMVSRISESAELPDFSSIFVTEQVTNSTDDVNEVDHKSSCIFPTIANGVVSPHSETVEIGDQYIVTCADDFTLTGNANMMCQDDNVFDQTPTCQASGTETASQNANNVEEASPKEPTSPAEPAPEPTTEQTEKVTVKDHEEIPDAGAQTDDTPEEEVLPEPVEPKPSPSEPAEPKVTLPNEVPAVVVTSAPDKESVEEEKETVEEEVAEDNNVYENKEPDMESQLKVEVDIHDVHNTSSGAAYTQKDVIFWLAVVGGSCLILFGVGTIVRVYRNKGRRLYASLTDDYLINGMYSI